MLKEVKKFGTSGHIIFPKELIGHSLEIHADEIIGDNSPVTKKEVIKIVEDAIYKAKAGYS